MAKHPGKKGITDLGFSSYPGHVCASEQRLIQSYHNAQIVVFYGISYVATSCTSGDIKRCVAGNARFKAYVGPGSPKIAWSGPKSDILCSKIQFGRKPCSKRLILGPLPVAPHDQETTMWIEVSKCILHFAWSTKLIGQLDFGLLIFWHRISSYFDSK
jgi:hypothetical protein